MKKDFSVFLTCSHLNNPSREMVAGDMQCYCFQSDQELSWLAGVLHDFPSPSVHHWDGSHTELLPCWHHTWLGPLFTSSPPSSEGLFVSEISHTSAVPGLRIGSHPPSGGLSYQALISSCAVFPWHAAGI